MTPRGAAPPPAKHPAVPVPPRIRGGQRPWRRDSRSHPRQPLRLALLLGLLLALMVGVPVLVLAIAPTARAEDWSAPPGDSPTSQGSQTSEGSEDPGVGELATRQPAPKDPSTPPPAAEASNLAQATDAAQQLLTATPPQP